MFKRTMMAAAAAGLVAACGGGDDGGAALMPPAPTPVAVGDTVVLTASGRLVSFDRAAPATPVGAVGITGLAAGETLLGLDQRPADGLLYALSSQGMLYTLDPATGVATPKVALKAAAADDNPYAALAGSDFALDFNPVADRLRVVSNAGQNLRVNVDSGDAITDGTIALPGGAAAVSAAGYTNAFAGASTTALFDLDAARGLLHLQDPPNSGTLAVGVALGLTAEMVNGFDVDARNNAGYAALTVGASTGLYRIDLAATAAAATRVGDVAGGEGVRGLALLQPEAPLAIGLTADNRLVRFDPKAPNTLLGNVAIGGLAGAEQVLGIDIRPADGALYALTDAGRVYTVDATTGQATLKSTLVADPTDTTQPYAGPAGMSFSVDFNPVADRLRVIGDQGQNLRINVDTGATTTDGAINRAGNAPRVLAAAYANSFAGAATTVLYDLDATDDRLTRQNPPNDGTLADVGALGLDLDGTAAFDIAGGANGLALVALQSGGGGPSTLYGISLATGALSLYRNSGDPALSLIGGAAGPALRDLAIRF
jgi:outer membrane protein assembly factor BamB